MLSLKSYYSDIFLDVTNSLSKPSPLLDPYDQNQVDFSCKL